MDAVRGCFCVTSQTVAWIVSGKVVNAFDPKVETPIVTVIVVLADAGDWT